MWPENQLSRRLRQATGRRERISGQFRSKCEVSPVKRIEFSQNCPLVGTRRKSAFVPGKHLGREDSARHVGVPGPRACHSDDQSRLLLLGSERMDVEQHLQSVTDIGALPKQRRGVSKAFLGVAGKIPLHIRYRVQGLNLRASSPIMRTAMEAVAYAMIVIAYSVLLVTHVMN